jgi:hypothetical protein
VEEGALIDTIPYTKILNAALCICSANYVLHYLGT